MNNIELNKEFEKLKEISDVVIRAEYLIGKLPLDSDSVINQVEKFKFICLKYNLSEIDELENLSALDEAQLLKFCGEIKDNIKQEFIEIASNNA